MYIVGLGAGRGTVKSYMNPHEAHEDLVALPSNSSATHSLNGSIQWRE
jgi:hypothetical protein